jgi:hypothetical protein
MDTHEAIVQGLVYSDDVTFYTSGKTNQIYVCGTEKHAKLESQKDSPKMKFYCVYKM